MGAGKTKYIDLVAFREQLEVVNGIEQELRKAAIDAGKNAFIPADVTDEDADGNIGEPTPFDLIGSPRVFGEIVDMGAYEVQTFKAVSHRYDR